MVVHDVVLRLCVSGQVAAVVAAGAVGSIKESKRSDRAGVAQATREEDVLVCVNVTMTKTTLKVAVCALPTDVAYNRCVRACLCFALLRVSETCISRPFVDFTVIDSLVEAAAS